MAWTTQLLVSSASLVLITDTTQRGFTNHEMLDEVDIIHMNGRIYDGRLGRFLQADPLIQEPNNSQSLNRYSYVINNPLSYTDPTGYSFISKLWKKIRPFVGIIAMFIPGGQGFGAAMLKGFIVGGIATGNLQGAVIGAFAAGAFQQIGPISILSQVGINSTMPMPLICCN